MAGLEVLSLLTQSSRGNSERDGRRSMLKSNLDESELVCRRSVKNFKYGLEK